MNRSESESARRNQLDTLRFFCFLAVFLQHCGIPITVNLGNKLVITGGHGLQAFFVISGFLITRLLLERESENKLSDICNFYIRRALRIMPLYYFYLFILMIQNKLEHPLWYFTGLYNNRVLIPGYKSDAACHLWSLCVEAQFYLLFPWILLFCKPRFRLPVLVCSLLVSFTLYTFWRGDYTWYLLPVNALFFLVGALFAFWDLKYKETRFDSFFAITGIVIFLSWLALGASEFGVSKGSLIDLSSSFMSILCLVVPQIVLVFLQMLGLGFLVIGVWRLSNPVALRILKNPVTTYLGMISYGLYVYHLYFLYYNPSPTAWDIVFAFVSTIIVSAISWRFLERPFNRLRLSLNRNTK